jgi:hypothetical protein
VAGVAFELIAVAFIALAFAHHRQVAQALARGEFAPPDDRLMAALSLLGGLLGILLVVALAVAD